MPYSFQNNLLELYDRQSAPLELKIQMLRAEVLETKLYDCVSMSPRAGHFYTLRQAHHSFLTCIGWRRNNRTNILISYMETSIKTVSESTEAIVRRGQNLFPGLVARMEDTSLPKCMVFGELVGGTECVGGQGKGLRGCLVDDLRAFGINADYYSEDDCSPGRRGTT